MLDRTLVAKETAPPTGKWNIMKLKTLRLSEAQVQIPVHLGEVFVHPCWPGEEGTDTTLRFLLIPVTMAMVVLKKAKESQCCRGREVVTFGFRGKAALLLDDLSGE